MRIDNIKAANTVMVPGHRPKSMGWGYDLSAPCWQGVLEACREVLVKSGCTDAWTGMALGVDTVFARAVLSLKDEGHPIRLHCAVPFQGQESKWRPDSVAEYRAILSRADEVVVVSPGGYAGWKMTERDRFMAGKADKTVAVWNGSNSGTGRCVAYIRELGKPVYVIDPHEISLETGC